jgi:hypothetical protein
MTTAAPACAGLLPKRGRREASAELRLGEPSLRLSLAHVGPRIAQRQTTCRSAPARRAAFPAQWGRKERDVATMDARAERSRLGARTLAPC